MIFKSKLYREEIKHWSLILMLFLWASVASYQAFKNKEELILISVSESQTRLITESFDPGLKNEFKNFLTEFLETYYTYDEKNFSSQMDKASNLMNLDFFELQKPKLLELQAKLQSQPLVQSAEIESIDQVEPNKIEAQVNLKVKSKLSEHNFKIKVRLALASSKRSKLNPWGFEVTEVSDDVL